MEMQIRILCSELVRAIGGVLPGIATRELFDQADKLAFQDGRVISYNDQISISSPVVDTAGNVVPFSGSIDGRRLYDLLSKVDRQDDTIVKLIADEENQKLFIEYPRTKTVMVDGVQKVSSIGIIKATFGLVPVNMPLEEIDWSGEYIDLPKKFTAGLTMVYPSCARELSRPVLTCVKMSGKTLLASDGYRVATLSFGPDDDPDIPDLPDILLPMTTAHILVRGGYNIEQVAVGDSGDWGRFRSAEGVEFCTRLIVGTYPDLSDVLAIENGALLAIKGEAIKQIGEAVNNAVKQIKLPMTLITPVERAHIFAKREHRVDELVMITLQKRLVVLNAKCDGVEYEELIRDPEQVAEAKFDVHPEFLLATLGKSNMIEKCILADDRIGFIGTGNSWRHIVTLQRL